MFSVRYYVIAKVFSYCYVVSNWQKYKNTNKSNNQTKHSELKKLLCNNNGMTQEKVLNYGNVFNTCMEDGVACIAQVGFFPDFNKA